MAERAEGAKFESVHWRPEKSGGSTIRQSRMVAGLRWSMLAVAAIGCTALVVGGQNSLAIATVALTAVLQVTQEFLRQKGAQRQAQIEQGEGGADAQ